MFKCFSLWLLWKSLYKVWREGGHQSFEQCPKFCIYFEGFPEPNKTIKGQNIFLAKIFSKPKSFGTQNCFVLKFLIGTKKNFRPIFYGPNFFQAHNVFWPRFFGPKSFWILNLLDLNLFGYNFVLDPQYIWTSKLFESQNFLNPKFMDPNFSAENFLRYKISLDQKIFLI